ncbi:MAG: hypothetical protein Q8891_13255 [Bacteroidota bacterium]|jgi:hypothetical protein|nr:hypothetical protein [Bacteroidota bacterium]
MENNFSDFEMEPLKRSSFLTVLCVLTFVGSGWALLSSIWTFSSASKTSETISQRTNMRLDSTLKNDSVQLNNGHQRPSFFRLKTISSLSKIFTKENLQKSAVGSFISAILTLLGALFMWRLQRKGFYLYIFGIFAGIIFPLIIYGNNLVAIGISSFSSFFGLVFIALYALNLKSMKPGNGQNES